MVCTPKVETEGVQGVVHSIHHVLPLHTISHMADSVANHTIGQILPFHKDKGKDSKDKKKKKKMVIDLTSLKSVTLSTDTAKPKNFSSRRLGGMLLLGYGNVPVLWELSGWPSRLLRADRARQQLPLSTSSQAGFVGIPGQF